MWDRIARIAGIAAHLPLSKVILCVMAVIFIGAVCTAPSSALAQAAPPTPTPNPEIVKAREDALREKAAADQLARDYQNKLNDLDLLKKDLDVTGGAAQAAIDSAARSGERANALDAQAAWTYASQAALLAVQAQYSVTLALNRVIDLQGLLPSVITLTQQNGQLMQDNSVLRTRLSASSDQIASLTQRVKSYEDKPQPPPLDPALPGFGIAVVLILAGTFLAYRVTALILSNRSRPQVTFALPAQARDQDEDVIDG